MKKFTLFISMALVAMSINAAELQIGNHDSSSKYAPIYADQADRLFISQIIYTADELSEIAGHEITKLTFELRSQASNCDWSNISISAKEVDFTAFSGSEFASIDGAKEVFSGTVIGSASTTVEIELAQPFVYEGGNLLLDFRKTTTGGAYSRNWKGFYATQASDYRVISKYSSSGSMPEEGVRSLDRPDVIITYTAEEQAIELTEVNSGAIKRVENGQLIVIKNGVKYNALGAAIK